MKATFVFDFGFATTLEEKPVGKPPGLKIFRQFAGPKEIAAILAAEEFSKNPGGELFRLFGRFGGKPAGEPATWMLDWGQRLKERGVFAKDPNQFRVCDWIGDHSSVFKWHIDNRRHGERIFVLSLSANRALGFRSLSDRRSTYELTQEAGDAYLIGGAARWSWEHCVLPRGKDKSGGRSFVVSLKRQR